MHSHPTERDTQSKQNEPCKGLRGIGRHAREAEGEQGMKGRRRESKACKGGRGRGRHAMEAEEEEGMQERLR